MQRTKVFLSLTTCILGVTGIIVANSRIRHQVPAKIYTLSDHRGGCVPYGLFEDSTSTPIAGGTAFTANGNILYTATNPCRHTLYLGG